MIRSFEHDNAESFLGGRVEHHDNVFRFLLDCREEGRAEEESSIRAAFSEDDGNKSCWQGVSLCTTDELFLDRLLYPHGGMALPTTTFRVSERITLEQPVQESPIVSTL